METEITNSNSSSFEDLVKDHDVKDSVQNDDFMDILGNNQLTKKILVHGTSDTRPQRYDICKINYEAKLENGEEVENVENFSFQLGDLEVPQGLDMGIGLMNVGEKSEVHCSPRFAYGSLGLPEKNIPEDSKLIYTIELVSTHEETDIEKKSYKSRKEIGNKKRERGNFYFERQEYNSAIQLYRRALEYLDESDGGITSPVENSFIEPTNEQLQDLLEDRIKVYNNMAQSQMKIHAFDAALKSVDMVLTCQPNNVKALFRKSKILEAKTDISSAIPLLRKAANLEPENKSIQNELSRLILKSKREAQSEKNLYQKMLGQAQILDKRKPQCPPSKPDTNTNVRNRLKLWTYTLGSVLIGVAAIAFYRYKYSS
ncbi:CLUMA_CG011490, isoform A [Clunio marinus]|uniref:peptidylprolyl isomerase n=1 Tax=Clunio marinus TaxID=568069 RepID=A0A1J1IEC5_9DIPT|nr:CLUMA_CG011490, isoform A [Clunio marinus]